MNVSLEWLNSYLDRPIADDEAEQVLTEIGFPIEEQAKVGDDVMLDVEVTSNRPDVLSHVGVAREVAAATGRRLLEPAVEIDEAGDTIESSTRVDNEAVDLCPMYTARLIRGVKVKPSPDWMKRRLEAVGLRPINNVVDVTNYVMYELGQPLHAFDFNLLAEKRIVVRRAHSGEDFEAIDHSHHKLRDDMLVIADGERAVAVAGVMGGVNSEVIDRTTDVLIEAARFDPLSIRTTSRALKLSSDSSYRFERGIDPVGVDRASQRAAQLMLELAGGTLCEGVIAAGDDPVSIKSVSLRPDRCNQLLGYELTAEEIADSLTPLGLEPVIEHGEICCTVPSFRLDLYREVDLIEEIARMQRFDRIEIDDRMSLDIRQPQAEVAARRAVTSVLVARGYHETVTFSNVPTAQAKPFLEADSELAFLSEEQKKAEPALRPSLLPSLLAVRKANQDAGNTDVRLFELAHVFCRRGDGYGEARHLSMLADAPDREQGMRRMRGVIEQLLETTGMEKQLKIVEAPTTPSWAEAGAALIDTNDQNRIVGQYGPASGKIIDLFDLTTPVVMGWIDYVALTESYPPDRRVSGLPRYPGIARDLSVVVDEATPWAKLVGAVEATTPAMLEQVDFVGVYRGKQVGKGKKSVTFRMIFRNPDKTLRHDEVDPQVNQVVERLTADVGAKLRTG